MFEVGNMVRQRGLEPPRYCYRQPLKLVRLPVPPLPHFTDLLIIVQSRANCEVRTRRRWAINFQTGRYGFFGCAGTGCCVAGAGALLLGAVDCGAVDCGVVCGFAGVTGAGFGAGFENFSSTEPPCSTPLSVCSTSAIAHTMNIIAHHVVARESTVAAPRGPNAVWLPAPPNAPAMSAALPLCSSTTIIKNRQFTTKNVGNSQENQRESESLQPSTINPNPRANEIAHFIQTDISQPH